MRKVLLLTILIVTGAYAQCVPTYDPFQGKVVCSFPASLYPGVDSNGSNGLNVLGSVSAAFFQSPAGTAAELGGACETSAAASLPASGEYTMFYDSANSCKLSKIDHSRNVTVVEGRVANGIASVNNAASPYTITLKDSYVSCDATAGAVAASLPAATGTGREITVKKTDSGTNGCTANRAGSDTIDGATSVTVTLQNAAFKLVDVAAGKWHRTDLTTELYGKPFCDGFNPSAGQTLQLTASSTPNPCWTSTSSGGGSGFTMNTAGQGIFNINRERLGGISCGYSGLTGSDWNNGAWMMQQFTVPFTLKLGNLLTISRGTGSGDVFVVAIYNDDGSGHPGTKISGTDVVIYNSGGAWTWQQSWGSHVTLSPGTYWVGYSQSSTSVNWCHDQGDGSAESLWQMYRAVSPPKMVQCGNTVTYSGSSTTLPSSCTSPVATWNVNTIPPVLGVIQ